VSNAAITAPSALTFSRKRKHWLLRGASRHATLLIGGILIVALIITSIAAPLLTAYDPVALDVAHRLRPPSSEHWFGTDNYGRDILSRTLHGGRISLLVGLSVALLSSVIGVCFGLLAGMYRRLDPVIMRIMDGVMAIPAILLAVAMMALTKPGLATVIIAITVPEVPRVVRLVRSVVLVIREQPYVEAAIAIGTRVPRLLLRHILPNALTPIIVQATYVGASAVLLESYLGFLGVGIPPETPSWGNILSDGRSYIQLAFWIIFFPGVFLGLMVMGINLLGDGLRDLLDPKLARRL
jgi:peptide/nickel transport system permease protein